MRGERPSRVGVWVWGRGPGRAGPESGTGSRGGGVSPQPDPLPVGETISADVPALLAGVRVDRGVAMVANVSRGAAAELIDAGRVLVDGVPVSAGRVALREGATITVLLPEPRDAGVAAEPGVLFGVVYEDPLVAVVDKPAGLVVHPGAGHDEGTLVGGLLSRFPDLAELVTAGVCAPDRPGIVHRLDKGTSGLLAVARTADAYHQLVDQLATRTMERRYLALVAGIVAEDRGEVEAPIGRSARTPTKMAVTAAGKPARTGYTVVERRGRGDADDPARALPPERAGPTRSGSTWRPSGTPWWGTPATGPRTSASARAGSSCTPSSWRSSTRARRHGWSSTPRSPRT